MAYKDSSVQPYRFYDLLYKSKKMSDPNSLVNELFPSCVGNFLKTGNLIDFIESISVDIQLKRLKKEDSEVGVKFLLSIFLFVARECGQINTSAVKTELMQLSTHAQRFVIEDAWKNVVEKKGNVMDEPCFNMLKERFMGLLPSLNKDNISLFSSMLDNDFSRIYYEFGVRIFMMNCVSVWETQEASRTALMMCFLLISNRPISMQSLLYLATNCTSVQDSYNLVEKTKRTCYDMYPDLQKTPFFNTLPLLASSQNDNPLNPIERISSVFICFQEWLQESLNCFGDGYFVDLCFPKRHWVNEHLDVYAPDQPGVLLQHKISKSDFGNHTQLKILPDLSRVLRMFVGGSPFFQLEVNSPQEPGVSNIVVGNAMRLNDEFNNNPRFKLLIFKNTQLHLLHCKRDESSPLRKISLLNDAMYVLITKLAGKNIRFVKRVDRDLFNLNNELIKTNHPLKEGIDEKERCLLVDCAKRVVDILRIWQENRGDDVKVAVNPVDEYDFVTCINVIMGFIEDNQDQELFPELLSSIALFREKMTIYNVTLDCGTMICHMFDRFMKNNKDYRTSLYGFDKLFASGSLLNLAANKNDVKEWYRKRQEDKNFSLFSTHSITSTYKCEIPNPILYQRGYTNRILFKVYGPNSAIIVSEILFYFTELTKRITSYGTRSEIDIKQGFYCDDAMTVNEKKTAPLLHQMAANLYGPGSSEKRESFVNYAQKSIAHSSLCICHRTDSTTAFRPLRYILSEDTYEVLPSNDRMTGKKQVKMQKNKEESKEQSTNISDSIEDIQMGSQQQSIPKHVVEMDAISKADDPFVVDYIQGEVGKEQVNNEQTRDDLDHQGMSRFDVHFESLVDRSFVDTHSDNGIQMPSEDKYEYPSMFNENNKQVVVEEDLKTKDIRSPLSNLVSSESADESCLFPFLDEEKTGTEDDLFDTKRPLVTTTPFIRLNDVDFRNHLLTFYPQANEGLTRIIQYFEKKLKEKCNINFNFQNGSMYPRSYYASNQPLSNTKRFFAANHNNIHFDDSLPNVFGDFSDLFLVERREGYVHATNGVIPPLIINPLALTDPLQNIKESKNNDNFNRQCRSAVSFKATNKDCYFKGKRLDHLKSDLIAAVHREFPEITSSFTCKGFYDTDFRSIHNFIDNKDHPTCDIRRNFALLHLQSPFFGVLEGNYGGYAYLHLQAKNFNLKKDKQTVLFGFNLSICKQISFDNL